MNKQNENIDSFIRKVFTLVLFLFLLLALKSKDYSAGSPLHKGPAIEHVFQTDFSAILVEPLSFPGFNNSLVSYNLHPLNNSNTDSFKIICSNNKTNCFLLLGKKRFRDIKTHIFERIPHKVRASLNSEDIPLIS